MNERELLMIPGPVNFDPGVLRAMGMPTLGHTSSEFISIFGETLERVRQVFGAPTGLPFVIAGSGTFAMECAVANLVEYGDAALVISTGYFSERIVQMCERYGGEVIAMRAPVGDIVSLDAIEEQLERVRPKVVTVTHVDTSTGVVMDVKSVAALGKRYGALVIVDGVCSVGGIGLEQDLWGIDVALTGSQKAMGVPPGLGILVASPRAVESFRARKRPTVSFYADWANWIPVMEAYLARKASYFATPAVNLIYALNESLRQVLAEGMEARIARHSRLSAAFKAGIKALGLDQVPLRSEIAATTMTAPYFPEGIDTKLVSKIRERGVAVAGGLHPAIRERYFRVGHMGVVTYADIFATLSAIERALAVSGYAFEMGVGVGAAEKIVSQ